MVQLSKSMPEFGGLFINKSDRLTIYLTHPTKQKTKAAAILSNFEPLTKSLSRLRANDGKYQLASVSNMIIKKGHYTFTKLYRWKRKVTGKILPMTGVFANSIDENQNKLSIGVKNKSAKTKVIEKLAQLNIPSDAVIIYNMSPPVLLSSLTDKVSTFSGGLMISNYTEWCTMGPIVRWKESVSGSYKTGYITASHCTPPMGGGVYGVQFYQPTQSSGGHYAGIEIRDPLFAPNKCWDTGQECRESDAALISYPNAILHPLPILPGSIYKTTGRGRNAGSRIIPNLDRRFYIKGIDNFIPTGIENNKIGARTGWTYGPVTDICTDFSYSCLTYVCQNVVQAGADQGDSGAPVFEKTTTPDSVIFAGILSGSFTKDNKPYFWYSSVTRIKNELSGPNVIDLTFTAPQPAPLNVNISGPIFIYSSGSYTWEADFTHGNGNYHYKWQFSHNVNGPWSTLSFSKTYNRYVMQHDETYYFYLRVTVTSSLEKGTDKTHVVVLK